MTSDTPTRILLADDHPLVCAALRSLLEPTFAVVGAVHRGDEVVETVHTLKPDLILLDVSMPGRNGIDVARQLRRELPALLIVLLTMHTEPAYVQEAWRIGVHGFVLKLSEPDEIRRSIADVVSGQRYLSRQLSPAATWRNGDPISLSVRHTEILRLIAEGVTAPEIGRRLGIGPKTVDYHRIAIRRILGLRNNADLVRYAVAAGLVKGPPNCKSSE